MSAKEKGNLGKSKNRIKGCSDSSTQPRHVTHEPLTTQRSPRRSAFLLLGVAIFVSFIPLLLLFNLSSKFYWDWYNHLWLVEYFGEYLRVHWTAPYAINTNDLVGLVNPLFYGHKFYAAMGFLSACVGPSIAVRIGVLALMVLQFIHVERAFYESTRNRVLSCSVGALLCWATYPLTNLYNRSALTEFFAVGFLNISVSCLFVLGCRSLRNRKSWYDAVAVGLFYVAAAATHPLTALFGGIFIAVLGCSILIVVRNRWLVCAGIANAIGIGIILAPWLLLMSKFRKLIEIGISAEKTPSFSGDGFFADSIDSFWSRICPLPLDLRSLEKGISIPTPYLDAQCIVGYLLLAGLLVHLYLRFGDRKRQSTRLAIVMLAVALVLFAFSFFLSVNPTISSMFGGFFDILQFPYRLTAYINLSLLVVVLSLGELCGTIRTDPQTASIRAVVVTACISVAFCSVILKLIHADTAREYRPPSIGREPTVLDLPSFFYGANDFATISLYKTTPSESLQSAGVVRFQPKERSHFGEIGSMRMQLDKPSLVVFNVAAFPWNSLRLNGSPVAREDLSFVRVNMGQVQGTVIATRMEAGNYTAEYQFVSERIWVYLEFLSWFFSAFWVAWWSVLMFRAVHRGLVLPNHKLP